MNFPIILCVNGAVVEETVQLSLNELCQVCGIEVDHVSAWVLEGVLDPIGQTPVDWRFSGDSLRRARMAQRLSLDLGINAPGVALAMELLDEITILRARLNSTRTP
jgi:chaperone modulatory protein CbpM